MKPSRLYAAFIIALTGMASPAVAADTVGLIGPPPSNTGLSWEHRPEAAGASWGTQVAFWTNSPLPASLRNVVVWGTYEWPLVAGTRLGLLLGGSYNGNGDFNTGHWGDDLMLVGGLSLSTESGPFFLRCRPQWVYARTNPGVQTDLNDFPRSGLPWAEFGFHLAPWLDLSLRYAITPVRLAWRF